LDTFAFFLKVTSVDVALVGALNNMHPVMRSYAMRAKQLLQALI
jgi:hypothetical protein